MLILGVNNMAIYENIAEEIVKHNIANDWFEKFDYTTLGDIDFCIAPKNQDSNNAHLGYSYYLWAEAKKDRVIDTATSFVQLLLTIGKNKFYEQIPPTFLGVLDSEKISFVEYTTEIRDIFYLNDFNWNVKPSDHSTREFRQLYSLIKESFEESKLEFHFENDSTELRKFINQNFKENSTRITKIRISKTNFISVYNKWVKYVKKSIRCDWDAIKEEYQIVDGDFYLADLLSKDNFTLKDKLFILLQNNQYVVIRNDFMGGRFEIKFDFKDNQKAHKEFWNRYERPPKKEYWDYIINRRDLLVPQNYRERKGSFFTPKEWVEKAHEYLTKVFGENWQDEFYVWDCCAGTGNLLSGLVDKYRIFASTLDEADINVIKDGIHNGVNLLEKHVFQFDFLNDEFTKKSDGGKIPDSLFEIIDDEQKRKKLIILINPPYAEASDKKTESGEEAKNAVEQSMINKKYSAIMGQANAELFAQFFIRIKKELNGCILAQFSKLKHLTGQHFDDFRKSFKARPICGFLVPANTFDNVSGKFPIAFIIWDTSIEEEFSEMTFDVFERDNTYIGKKHVKVFSSDSYMNEWVKEYRANKDDLFTIGKFPFKGNDVGNTNYVCIVHINHQYNKEAGQFLINADNLIIASVYFAARKCIDDNWLNDRDQFYRPDDSWKDDIEFQNDCLAWTLFSDSNMIQSNYGINHWIPFSEQEVNSPECFESHFMSDFINGRLEKPWFFYGIWIPKNKIEFSKEANDLFNSGRKLWSYYLSKENVNLNASLYDIRLYFQGTKWNAKRNKFIMNSSSNDETYMQLYSGLSNASTHLLKKIRNCVLKYQFFIE